MAASIAECVDRADLQAALELLEGLSPEAARSALLEYAFSTGSIVAYAIAQGMVTRRNDWASHYLASEIMAAALNHIEGAYVVALFHARQALDLNQSDIELWEYLLLFHAIPERLVSDEEAVVIAGRILADKPESSVAQMAIRRARQQ